MLGALPKAVVLAEGDSEHWEGHKMISLCDASHSRQAYPQPLLRVMNIAIDHPFVLEQSGDVIAYALALVSTMSVKMMILAV